jgi:hypothetical protein
MSHLRVDPDASCLTQINLIHDFVARIKLTVTCLRFHKSLPLRLATVSLQVSRMFSARRVIHGLEH